MAVIKTTRDKNGRKIYPVTCTDAIVGRDGKPLKDGISEIVNSSIGINITEYLDADKVIPYNSKLFYATFEGDEINYQPHHIICYDDESKASLVFCMIHVGGHGLIYMQFQATTVGWWYKNTWAAENGNVPEWVLAAFNEDIREKLTKSVNLADYMQLVNGSYPVMPADADSYCCVINDINCLSHYRIVNESGSVKFVACTYHAAGTWNGFVYIVFVKEQSGYRYNATYSLMDGDTIPDWVLKVFNEDLRSNVESLGQKVGNFDNLEFEATDVVDGLNKAYNHGGSGGGISDAPSDGKKYARKDGAWSEVTDGKDGQDGENGADGKSAYQIAVDNGFVGTKEEWLTSLVGEKGETGERGLQGNTGSSVEYPFELVNNLTTDDATKGLSASMGKVISHILGYDNLTDNADLDICDESGNVLVRFSNGHIRTKHFDSKSLSKKEYEYFGDRIVLSKHSFDISKFVLSGITGSRQGFDQYGDIAVLLCDKGVCNIIDRSTLSVRATFNLASYATNNHSNCVNFGNTIPNGTNYPLMYVSIAKVGSSNSFTCSVEKLLNSGDEYSTEQVQTIRLDQSGFEQNGLKKYWDVPCWLVDKERGFLWTFGAIKRTTTAVTTDARENLYIAHKYNIPSISEQDVILTSDDVLDECIFPFDVWATQGGTIYDGKIYYCFGFGGTGIDCSNIRVYDTDKKCISSKLVLSNIVPEECEDISIVNGSMYLNTNSQYLYKIDF